MSIKIEIGDEGKATITVGGRTYLLEQMKVWLENGVSDVQGAHGDPFIRKEYDGRHSITLTASWDDKGEIR